MTGTSAIAEQFLHQIDSAGAGEHHVKQNQVRRVFLHEANCLLRSAGHNRRIPLIGKGIVNVPERVRIVVHRKDTGPLPRRTRRKRSWPGRNLALSLNRHRKCEGEPGVQVGPVALGLDAPRHAPPRSPCRWPGPGPLPQCHDPHRFRGKTSETGAAAYLPVCPCLGRIRKSQRGTSSARRSP